jgi:hypothetical protein
MSIASAAAALIATSASAVRSHQPVKPPTAADIQHRLSVAETEYSEAEAEHGQAAFDREAGVSGAADRVATAFASLAVARDRLASLRAAHVVAAERDAAAARASRAAIQSAQIRAVRSHLAARDAAAIELSVAIENACAAFKVLVHRSTKAAAANPIGGQWPPGSMTDFGDLKRLVEGELWRCGGEGAIGASGSFPGGRPPTFDHQNNPAGLPPMADGVKAASAHCIAVLTGRAA